MPNYIMDLRKNVGHKPLLMVGASVIVEDAEGKILLQQRTDNHCWGYPGGALELGETLENAARRELTEETGLIANKLELFGVFPGKNSTIFIPIKMKSILWMWSICAKVIQEILKRRRQK